MKAKWDQPSEHFYKTGIEQCMLYPQDSSGAYPKGYAWSGITGISEKPSGGDATKLYADDTVYLNLRAVEEFGGTITAYMYPDEFAQCNGEESLTTGVVLGQQSRKAFGLAYKTKIGNDTDGSDHGEELHLVYGCTCSPSERSFETINDSPSAIEFSWDYESVPTPVTGHKNVSCIVINMTKLSDAQKKAVEDAIFGTDPSTASAEDDTDPYLPLPDALKSLIDGATT